MLRVRLQANHADVPEEMRGLRNTNERFGLIVLDPPKFVGAAQQLESGCQGYKDINMLAMQLLKRGGVPATSSCSGHVSAEPFQKIVAGATVDANRDMQILERMAQSSDQPVALPFSEAEYLKGLILRAAH